MLKYIYLVLLLLYSSGVISAILPVFDNDTSNYKTPAVESLTLKPHGYKKSSVKEFTIFKFTQKKIKKIIRKGKTIDQITFDKSSKEFKLHWGGFLLGFFLPGLGFIITFFIKDQHRRNRIFSALIGFTLILGLIGIFAFFKTISGG